MSDVNNYSEFQNSEVVIIFHKVSESAINKIMAAFSTCANIYRWLIIGGQWEELKSIEKYWGQYFDVNVIMLPEHVDIDLPMLNLILEAEKIDRKHSIIISSALPYDLQDDGFLHAEILDEYCKNDNKVFSNLAKILG